MRGRRKNFTPSDDALIRQQPVTGIDLKRLAQILRTNQEAIRHRATELGVSLVIGVEGDSAIDTRTLRSSELRGLRWQDIDFKKAELHVVRQRADKFRKIGPPKSEAGERIVPLPPMVVATLREWRLACPNGTLGLCFPNGKGNPEFHNNVIHRGLWPTLIAAGVVNRDSEGNITPKYTGLHALRHFYASWCINRKVDGGLELPPKVIQHRMGHSSIIVTLDTYGHLFPRNDDAKEMADAEAALLGLT